MHLPIVCNIIRGYSSEQLRQSRLAELTVARTIIHTTPRLRIHIRAMILTINAQMMISIADCASWRYTLDVPPKSSN